MNVKRKGKVYPTTSSLQPPPLLSCKDPDSVLKLLLPVTIFSLAFSLPIEDREVLAFLIARSLIVTTTTTNARKQRYPYLDKLNNATHHEYCAKKHKKIPPFECGCFECYTRYWYRWDSSPHRELIHQVIEEFEDHLLRNESSSRSSKKQIRGKGRAANNGTGNGSGRKSMVGSSISGSISSSVLVESDIVSFSEDPVKEQEKDSNFGGEMSEVMSEGSFDDVVVAGREESEEKSSGSSIVGEVCEVVEDMEMEVKVMTLQAMPSSSVNGHKCLARKVLPDVVGLFNSRLWSLWSPGI